MFKVGVDGGSGRVRLGGGLRALGVGWTPQASRARRGAGFCRALGVGLDTAGLKGLARGWFLQEADPCPRFLGAQPSAVSEDAVLGLDP